MKVNYIETESTRKVVHILRRYTDKPIEVKDLAEFVRHPALSHMANYLGSAKEYSNKIEVHLNFTKSEDVREAVFVHELLHIVLKYEGFPGIALRTDMVRFLQPSIAQVLENLRDRFQSTIGHLQVYKREVTDFSLSLDLYFEELVRAKIHRFGQFSYKPHAKDAEYFFQIQQDILDGLDYYQFPNPYSQKILAIFRETCPEGFAACLALHEKTEKISYSTPPLAYRCADLVRNQIIKYGYKKNVGTPNQLWSALNVLRNAKEIPLEKG
ncbi:MAG: hypothetical protein HY528_00915 [Chloroflexi bacterium]|nr:hypothetical protein [Chloroflexota bacterium]